VTSHIRVVRALLAGATVVLVWFVTVRAQVQPSASTPSMPDVQKLGPQVGERVPDFTLMDQRGRSRTLTSLTGPKGLMLVFFRSADW
jgi:cytochrome oxidase Cu insertion factor (SCO1/SenC/PrrC family)